MKPPTTTLSVPTDAATIIKPGEMIDVVEMTALTLTDRRIYNELIAHAWDRIHTPIMHSIPKQELRGSHNVNDRIGASVERLMAAQVRVRMVRNGKLVTQRMQLLGPTEEEETPDGVLRYTFPAELRRVMRKSTIFARIQRRVMYRMPSKYALALYEVIQRRGNLRHKHGEGMSIDEFRALLNVRDGNLERYADLHQRAIKPALAAINDYGEFGCTVIPTKIGRRVVGIRLMWWKKSAEEHSLAAARLALKGPELVEGGTP